MFKNQHVFITAILCLLATSMSAQWGGKKVNGNGNVTTRSVNTSDYDAIAARGSMDVHLERGTEGTINIKTDENLQEYVIVEVKEGVLHIRTKKNSYLKTKKGIHVYVPFIDIDEVSLTGSGDLGSKDPIQADQLELSITGSGDVDLEVDTRDLEVSVTGSGDMVVTGNTLNLEANVSGSGDFKGDGLNAAVVDVTVSGSGDAKVNASSQLRARVNGSGDIRYGGNPTQKDSKVSGSGSIRAH